MTEPLYKSALPGIRFPALPGAAGRQGLALQYQLERSQWLPPEELQRMQLMQARSAIAHAAGTVPFYRELYGARRDIPPQIDLDFVRSLPVARRAAVGAAGAALLSERIPAAHGKLHSISTSGSTGTPVKLSGTGWIRILWRAFMLREHLWHGRDFSLKQGAIRWARRDVAAPPDGIRQAGWGRAVDEIFQAGPSCALNVASPVVEQVQWLLREQPAYLISFPSNLVALAEHCERHGIAMPWLKGIRTVGEMLTDAQRAACARAWPCPLEDVYTCEEAGYLALQCPVHPHYHVQSENVLLEVVDDQGAPCAAGESGQVLVTTLHNFATPLVRYELGDIAQVGSACPCGRGLPVLSRLHGRRRNRLRLPDGRSEFPYLGEHGQIHAETGVTVRQFQVIQRSVEEIEMRLVTDRPFTAGETERVVRLAQKNLGHPFRIVITLWDDIPKGARGKFEEFVSEVS
jgi:phenylacetate-CoA ligase